MEGKSKESAPSKTEARAVLFGAAGAFGAGLLGAIWYTKRKQAKEASLAAKSIDTPSSHAQITPAYVLPKMTPAEYAIAKRDATFFAFKTLGYGTLLALSGAGLLATAVGWWLDVRNFKEFSDKLQIIVPRQTARLRRFFGGSEFVMKEDEQRELNKVLEMEE